MDVAFPGLARPPDVKSQCSSDDSSDGSDIGTQDWLRKKIHGLKSLKALCFDPHNDKLSDHLKKFDRLIHHLLCIGMAFDDSDLLCQLLLTLPQTYEPLVIGYCEQGIPPMEIIQAKLLLFDGSSYKVKSKLLPKTANFNPGPPRLDSTTRNFPAMWSFKVENNATDDLDCEEYNDLTEDTNNLDDFDVEPTFELNIVVGEPEKDSLLDKMSKKTGKRKADGDPLKVTKKKFQCDSCDKSYNKRQNYSNHIRTHITEFDCKWCTETFTTYDDLKKHKVDGHPGEEVTCKVCEKVVNKKKFSQHTHNNEFLCCHCGKYFKSQLGLQMHVTNIHVSDEEKSKLVCPVCGKSVLKISMQSHMVLHKDKRFSCKICHKLFHWRNSLLIHMKNAHGHQLPYACELCDRQYVTESKLKGHMAAHRNEKAFLCDVCEKSFSAESSLRRHKQNFHSENGCESFSCEICGQIYLRKDNFNAHMRKHDRTLLASQEQTCSICQKDFMSMKDLQAHLKSHAGDSAFECAVCSLGFPSRKSFNAHNKSDLHLLAMAARPPL